MIIHIRCHRLLLTGEKVNGMSTRLPTTKQKNMKDFYEHTSHPDSF